jgi:hypothetical protein
MDDNRNTRVNQRNLAFEWLVVAQLPAIFIALGVGVLLKYREDAKRQEEWVRVKNHEKVADMVWIKFGPELIRRPLAPGIPIP